MTLPSAPLATHPRLASPQPKTATRANRPFARQAHRRSSSATGFADCQTAQALPSRPSTCGDKIPRRPFSPPTKHHTLPQHLGQASQPPQRRRFRRGKGRAHLTTPQPQSSPRSIFKVRCSTSLNAAQLACDGCTKPLPSQNFSAFAAFAPPRPFAHFLPQPLAQRWRQRHGGAVHDHGGQDIFARPAPTARPRRSRVRCTRGWVFFTVHSPINVRAHSFLGNTSCESGTNHQIALSFLPSK